MPTSTREHVWTVISGNRPLTRSARRVLQEYQIKDERHPGDIGHFSEVDVEKRPTEDLLESHELHLDDPTGGQEPESVFRSPNDKRVEIYADAVYTDGTASSIEPEEASKIAEQQEWERLE